MSDSEDYEKVLRREITSAFRFPTKEILKDWSPTGIQMLILQSADRKIVFGLGVTLAADTRLLLGGPLTVDEFNDTVQETKETKEDEQESPEDVRKRARKPPAEGPCRGCGKVKPLNRLMLCYSCWVKKELSDRGWREGQPHPGWCRCDLECRVEERGRGN